jgi:putative salt-induced outer membrane protein
MAPSRILSATLLAGILFAPSLSEAQETPPAPTGAPPPEAKALVSGPEETAAPKIEEKLDGTTISLSSGGQSTTGNSRLLALTINGALDTRWDNNGVGVSVLGNYGQGAPPGSDIVETAENIQARARYDRYVLDEASVFLLNTVRHDRFQGIDVRYNVDPGFKYLFLREATNSLWAEAGYDFQYDVRRNSARIVLDDKSNPVVDPATGQFELLSKTATDHSSRLFVGFKHAFNKEVTLSTGLEYLQSFVDSTRYRVNYDALVAAKIGGGLAFGVGFSARYDHAPLPGKDKTDTASTLSLIYAYSDVPEPNPKTCPCAEPTAPTPK